MANFLLQLHTRVLAGVKVVIEVTFLNYVAFSVTWSTRRICNEGLQRGLNMQYKIKCASYMHLSSDMISKHILSCAKPSIACQWQLCYKQNKIGFLILQLLSVHQPQTWDATLTFPQTLTCDNWSWNFFATSSASFCQSYCWAAFSAFSFATCARSVAAWLSATFLWYSAAEKKTFQSTPWMIL